MKTLLIHHLEELWSDGYKNFGTSFEAEAAKIANYIRKSDFERVLLVRMEDFDLGEEHHSAGLNELVDDVEIYAYGWNREELEEEDPEGEGVRWADGCDHSEVVLLDDWIKDLVGQDVTLVGAFEGECVATVSAAMDQCGVSYQREESLIVGTGVEYDLVLTEEEIDERINEHIEIDLEQVDRQDMPEWPSKRSALHALHSSIDGYSLDDASEVRMNATEELLGMNDLERVSVCLDDLAVSEELMASTEAVDISNNLGNESLDEISVKLVGDKLVVDPNDYPLIKLYRDYGIEAIAVEVDLADTNPYEHYGFDLSCERAFVKSQKQLARVSTYGHLGFSVN